MAAVEADADWELGIDCTQLLHIAEPITRDVYTREFWRMLGWTTLRVTPGMWLQERDAVLERIDALVRRDRAGARDEPASPSL